MFIHTLMEADSTELDEQTLRVELAYQLLYRSKLCSRLYPVKIVILLEPVLLSAEHVNGHLIRYMYDGKWYTLFT